LTKYIVFTGPESSGKSTMAEDLSREMYLPCVPECARLYMRDKRDYVQEDLYRIAIMQEAYEAQISSALVLCDTDLLTLYIWMVEVYGLCDLNWLSTLSLANKHYLLCTPDVPWEYDPLRENPHDRDRLYDVYKDTLDMLKLRYTVISGNDLHERKDLCKSVIRTYL
jgi:nicotinamide riboside kinase